MDADYIGFYSLPDLFYSGGSKETYDADHTPQNIKVRYFIKWWNPFSWTRGALQASGDIIHVQQWMPYTLLMYSWIIPILKLRGKTIIFTVHNITPHTVKRFIKIIDRVFNTFIFKFAEGFIVHNQRNWLKFQQLYHIDFKKILIATHGPIRYEARGVTKEDARILLGIGSEKKVLLFFGYLWRYKGLDTLLQALKGIVEHVPETLLLVAGQPIAIQGGWAPYESMITQNTLQRHVVTRLGFIPESQVEVLFQAADLVVLPYHEPFDTHGGAAALTITYHKPLLVTDIGGLPEYVKYAGAVSPPNDIKALERNIVRILQNDQLLVDLARDSEEKERELGWGPIAEKTIQFYKKILSMQNKYIYDNTV